MALSKKTAAEAVAALRQARESWLQLEEGRRLCVRRLPEALLGDLRRSGALGYCDTVVAWQGFTEADAFDGGDAASELPCEPELVRELLSDRADWLGLLIDHVRERVEQHAQAAEGRRKNSRPS